MQIRSAEVTTLKLAQKLNISLDAVKVRNKTAITSSAAEVWTFPAKRPHSLCTTASVKRLHCWCVSACVFMSRLMKQLAGWLVGWQDFTHWTSLQTESLTDDRIWRRPASSHQEAWQVRRRLLLKQPLQPQRAQETQYWCVQKLQERI